jgi:hypothetical protein
MLNVLFIHQLTLQKYIHKLTRKRTTQHLAIGFRSMVIYVLSETSFSLIIKRKQYISKIIGVIIEVSQGKVIIQFTYDDGFFSYLKGVNRHVNNLKHS